MANTVAWGFVGAGNMAEGIVAAALRGGRWSAAQIMVADPVEERRRLFAEKLGVVVTEDAAEMVRGGRRIVLAVKPQNFAEVAEQIAVAVRADHLLVSIMAGVSTKGIQAAFPNVAPRIVRVMPNLPIRVGAGMAGLYASPLATAQDVADVRGLFEAGGATVVMPDEALMDAVTAVAGSGPAYFYQFVEAMVAGGVACGLSQGDALKLAQYTCLGAARMMIETGVDPAELRRQVTSKGGTTQAALEVMAREHVPEAIRDAVVAAFKRGRELGGEVRSEK